MFPMGKQWKSITRGASKGRGRGARPGGKSPRGSKLKLGVWFHRKGESFTKDYGFLCFIYRYLIFSEWYLFVLQASKNSFVKNPPFFSFRHLASPPLGQPPGGTAVTKSASLPPLPENKVPGYQLWLRETLGHGGCGENFRNETLGTKVHELKVNTT